MWNTCLICFKSMDSGIKILREFSPCSRVRYGKWVKTTSIRKCSPPFGTRPITQIHTNTTPPWRILFFGSDRFAMESLKRLDVSRQEIKNRVVESLEVVTLSKRTPVRKYADLNGLRNHDWPNLDVHGQFDVGVVVSFGCLLPRSLIIQLPYGIINIHPSLLPKWRGPAPISHTILNGDDITGVTVMQIRPERFDVGPILHQEVCQVSEHCTADELGASLASMGAHLLMDTLRNLPERIANRKEQSKEGATFAPKISLSMSWILWEKQTCVQIDRLFRAIGTLFPLRTIWMERTIKLLDCVGKCNSSSLSHEDAVPGSIQFHKETNTLLVCCKDGWVGFKAVKLKKKLSAADFFNGHLHQRISSQQPCQFHSNKDQIQPSPANQINSTLLLNTNT